MLARQAREQGSTDEKNHFVVDEHKHWYHGTFVLDDKQCHVRCCSCCELNSPDPKSNQLTLELVMQAVADLVTLCE